MTGFYWNCLKKFKLQNVVSAAAGRIYGSYANLLFFGSLYVESSTRRIFVRKVKLFDDLVASYVGGIRTNVVCLIFLSARGDTEDIRGRGLISAV